MLAVAKVNECGFCTYVHHESALAAGADVSDLATMLDHPGASLNDDAIVAIMWAQRFADTGFGAVGEQLTSRLERRFDEHQRYDLESAVRAMTLINLSGNTLEALVRRLKGHRVPGSRLIDEVAIGGSYLIGAAAQGFATARMRGTPLIVAVREARAAIAAAT